MIANILLIKTFSHITEVAAPPLGLMSIAAKARREFGNSLRFKLIDMKIRRLSMPQMRQLIKNFNPDIIGCSVCTDEDDCLNELAGLAKKINDGCKVIVGGPHATMYYSDLLNNKNIDAAVIGEGEETFCDLIKSFNNGGKLDDIPGIAYRKNGEVVLTKPRLPIKNLDELPFPAWDLIDIDSYSKPNILNMNTVLAGRRYMGIFTSRGCPYQCIYCHNMFGKSFRMRSAESVFAELKELHDKFGVDEIHVFDDIFNFDVQRVADICDRICDSGIKIRIAFPNALRADLLDDETILKLKKAGTYAITFALETASLRLQRFLKKNMDLQKLSRIASYSSGIGLLTKCYTMIGFPTETEEEIKNTIDFVCNLPLEAASFFIVTPQNKTELYSLVKTKFPQFKIDFNRYNYYIPNKNYEQALTMPLARLQRFAYLKFFLNFNRLLRLYLKTPRKIFLFRCLFVFFERIMRDKS